MTDPDQPRDRIGRFGEKHATTAGDTVSAGLDTSPSIAQIARRLEDEGRGRIRLALVGVGAVFLDDDGGV